MARVAHGLACGAGHELETARRCFEFVRDRIFHSFDHRMGPVTLKASEVLAHRTGFCFAKSHLLAALLRANGIPAGLCYQRILLKDTGAHCIHGLNAVYLQGHGWYRADARGNKEGVDAQFTPPVERLACSLEHEGERDLPGIFADPLPEVAELLSRHNNYLDVRNNLPDIDTGARRT
ncbi:MAG TPA: transglutaminase-like domain-containing protein [Spirochaetota bacterium]|nr:transglutaminase-like domain-containing protein [Spirochaetota bacterium]HPG51914.1 transglutaminase-like domain-containing protein [Spirochaetota bacterium]HPN12997.1 transglutaminase-like domain-containing protein [Spirochaetota bacterium]HQL82095.1 transglutaminase-like domain-containing protein [Spirochaetota bacterium]